MTPIETIRKQDDAIVASAKNIIIDRIRELLKEHFGGKRDFHYRSVIRLDKMDLELDMVTTMEFTPVTLENEDEEVVLTYQESEYDPQDMGDYTWKDSLRDLSLSDCESILIILEEELSHPCPYCGSHATEPKEESRRLNLCHCTECDHLFDDEDIAREGLRHRLSPLLSGTAEDKPKALILPVAISEYSVCAGGFPSLVTLQVTGAFLFEDGTIWLTLKDEEPMNIDDLTIGNLRCIVEAFENE